MNIILYIFYISGKIILDNIRYNIQYKENYNNTSLHHYYYYYYYYYYNYYKYNKY